METVNSAPSDAIIDLSDGAPEDVAVLEVTRPGTIDGETIKMGWKITFAGPAHPKTVAYNEEQARKGLRQAQAVEAQQRNGRKVKADDTSLEEQRQSNVKWVMARIVSWEPAIRAPWIQEAPIRHDDPVVAEFLLHPKTQAFFAQMVDFLVADKSFTKRSATT